MTEDKKKYETQANTIGSAFLKTLEILEEKKLIEVDFIREEKKNMKNGGKGTIVSIYRTFFILNKENRPITLGRFKTED